ncbi:LysR family transcriptional regulator [Sinorhizobium medicae]|uniref:LysR substrate-binding domain-containing protein n=1 Tax=Sinorhizobium medicae TaxID=110321 RepID=UPI000FD7C654|nr:LysR substrate-binding domain-containing protein [Sinorhizobium medicae]RVK09297.1 LysR family transcriptional regulator [Sinorhizobium medicae]
MARFVATSAKDNREARRLAPFRSFDNPRPRTGKDKPHFESIAAGVNAISALRDKPSGDVRVVCPDDAVELVFRRRLSAFLRDLPDVTVEIIVDNGFTNIVERQFDAGVRLGEAVARDMVAMRIGPDVSYSVVASPDYLERHGPPSNPQDRRPQLRQPSASNVRGLYAREFERDGRGFSVRVEGQLTLSNIAPAIDAALDGIGLAYVPTDLVLQHVERGRLRQVLSDWCPTFQGYHLYYPSRRNPSPAFSAFVDAFRHR